MSRVLRLVGYGETSAAELTILEKEYARRRARGFDAPRLARAIENAKRRLCDPLPLAPAGWVRDILRVVCQPTHGPEADIKRLQHWSTWLKSTTWPLWRFNKK